MGILTKISSANANFKWEGTQDRAFEEIKCIVESMRNEHRVAIRYGPDVGPVNLVTDASLTGASGFISQGDDWKTAPVAKFWSGKFNSAQQNYAVHDRELLAIVASIKRFQSALHGVKFRIYTDHRALEHLMTQKNLSPRQARWLDFLSTFDFEIIYIEGTTNVFADALSRIYSNEAPGTQRSKSEYIGDYDGDELGAEEKVTRVTRPLLAGYAAEITTAPRRNPIRARRAPVRYDPSIPGRDIPKKPRKSVHRRVTVQEIPDHEAPKIVQPTSKPSARLGRKEPRVTIEEIPDPEVARNVAAEHDFQSPHIDHELEGETVPHNDKTIEPEVAKVQTPKDFERMTTSVSEIDVLESIRGKYTDDNQMRKVIENLSHHPNFKYEDGLLTLRDQGIDRLCVPDIDLNGKRVRMLLILHAHSLVAHLGSKKTYAYMHENLCISKSVHELKLLLISELQYELLRFSLTIESVLKQFHV